MRVGVICEGPTDFVAIECFFKEALIAKGFETSFIALQPDMDATQKHGGWTLVESWLKQNPYETRVRRYFGGGLFESSLDAKQCDVFLIQLDSDILDDIAFVKSIQQKHSINAQNVTGATSRREKLVEVLSSWCDMPTATENDKQRHVLCPAVESTEAWCLAAFQNHVGVNLEELNKAGLIVPFMTAIHRSEGRPVPANLLNIDKNTERRRLFCETNSGGHQRLAAQCPSFSLALTDLLKKAPDFLPS